MLPHGNWLLNPGGYDMKKIDGESDVVGGFLRSLRNLRPNSWTALAVFVVYTVASLQFASAQAVYGSIFGTVIDNTGAVIPNATVTITDVSKGTSVSTQSNATGDYRVDHLIPDTYTVTVNAPNFQNSAVPNVIVYADTAPKVDVQLQVGSTTTTVQVTNAPPVLQTDRADVSTVLNPRAVE